VVLLKDLLTALRNQADINPENLRTKQKDFPKSSKGLRGQLQRLDSNLRGIGITIEFLGRSGSTARAGASVEIDYVPEKTPQTSQHHNPSKTKVENGDVSRDVENAEQYSNVTDDQTSHKRHANVTKANANGTNGLAELRDESDVCDVEKRIHSKVSHKVSCQNFCSGVLGYIGEMCPDCGDVITDHLQDAEVQMEAWGQL